MAKLLDKKTLKSLPKPAPGSRMKFLADGAVGGLGVIWGARARPSWTLAYRDHTGHQIRVKIGFVWTGPDGQEPTPEWLGLDAARAEAYRIKKSTRDGVIGVIEQPPPKKATARAPMSFGAAIDHYLADPNVKALRSAGEVGRLLRRETAAIIERPLGSITRDDIRGVLDAKGATPIGNRLHSYLSTFYSWALDKGLVTASPVPNGRPLKNEVSRDRVLCDVELARVWHATERRPVQKRAIVRLMILTGQRREEVAGMRWSELDFEEKTWTVGRERYKTGASHTLPLTEVMIGIIEEQPRFVDSDFVFTINGRNAVDMSIEGGELKKAVGELPNGEWRLHDLRRTARTNWSKLGIPKEIRELLIHPKTGIEGTYDRHDFLAEKRTALELWCRHVAALISPS